jgi:hypothetical protein
MPAQREGCAIVKSDPPATPALSTWPCARTAPRFVNAGRATPSSKSRASSVDPRVRSNDGSAGKLRLARVRHRQVHHVLGQEVVSHPE